MHNEARKGEEFLEFNKEKGAFSEKNEDSELGKSGFVGRRDNVMLCSGCRRR